MKLLWFNRKHVRDFKWEHVAAVGAAVCWGFNTPEAFALIAGWPRRECGND